MELSMEKTRITDVREGFEFLGYRVVQEKSPATRRHVGILFIPKGKPQLLRDKIKAKVRKTPTGRTLADLIDELNPVIVGGGTTIAMPPGHGRSSRNSTGGWISVSHPGWQKTRQNIVGGIVSPIIRRIQSGKRKRWLAIATKGKSPSSLRPTAAASPTGAYEYRTDGTPSQTSGSAREPTSSGRRPTPSPFCEGHPWLMPRMESRMPGNLHVRFGEGDEETCPGDGARRFIPTLPKSLAVL